MTKMILVLTVIGAISAGTLAFVNNWSAPLIASNQKAETEAAIFRVQPEGEKYEVLKNTGFEVYRVIDNQNESVGFAMVYSGNGFQGKIRLIAGISEDLEEINALEVLEQSETPGLGSKILDIPFTDQFKKLKTSPGINYIKGKEPESPNEIQAITGATISSKAVVAIINEGIGKMKKLRETGSL
ncbi:MAG: FMN-binding protein [Ignavibacteriaceae bacterium]